MGYVLVHDYHFLAIRPYSHPGFFYNTNAANTGLRRRLFATLGLSRNSKIFLARGKGLVYNIENNDYFKYISLDNFTLYRNIHNSEQRILTNPNNTDTHFCSKENNWYELIYFNNYFQTKNIHFIISHFNLSKKKYIFCFE